jgi:hypothetical protein
MQVLRSPLLCQIGLRSGGDPRNKRKPNMALHLIGDLPTLRPSSRSLSLMNSFSPIGGRQVSLGVRLTDNASRDLPRRVETED